MSEYAKIEARKVKQIIVAKRKLTETKKGTFINVTNINPKPGIGRSYDGIIFTPPTPKKSNKENLIIVFSSTQIKPSVIFTATITATDSSDLPLPINKTYYAAITRESDGKQGQLIKIDLVNGTASNNLLIAEKGIYRLKADNITPTPTQKIDNEPTIIVI